jgi:hypothetical protein
MLSRSNSKSERTLLRPRCGNLTTTLFIVRSVNPPPIVLAERDTFRLVVPGHGLERSRH